MDLASTTEFMTWAADRGIGWSSHYPRARQLAFLETPAAWRAWDLPPDPGELGWFVELVLRTAAPVGTPVWIFPRQEGSWRFGGDRVPVANQALDFVARAAGIPADFQGAVRFDPPEFPGVLALAVASLVFGWGTGEDLFIIPDDAACILNTDHHQSFSGAFRSLAERDRFSLELVESGYEDLDVEVLPLA